MLTFELTATQQGFRQGICQLGATSLATPLLVYRIDDQPLLSAVELAELGAQCLATTQFYWQQHPGLLSVGQQQGLKTTLQWSGPLILLSGAERAEQAQPRPKWQADGVSGRRRDGSEYRLSPQPNLVDVDVMFTLLPPVLANTSKSRRKQAPTLAQAWLQQAAPVNYLECAVCDDADYAQQCLSAGEFRAAALWQLDYSAYLPTRTIRYSAECSTVEQCVADLSSGADWCDASFVINHSREGQFFDANTLKDINAKHYRLDQSPLSDLCDCTTCQQHTRSYLHHLYSHTPLLAMRLICIHNVTYIERWLQNLRNAAEPGKLRPFSKTS